MDETRIDRWLCAVRLAKTRPLATSLCVGGHVTINGVSAKPSSRVHVGDRIEARIGDRERILEVTKVIEARVGAQAAAECYVDHSPPPPPPIVELPPGFDPARSIGRPNKRLRRELERMRRRASG